MITMIFILLGIFDLFQCISILKGSCMVIAIGDHQAIVVIHGRGERSLLHLLTISTHKYQGKKLLRRCILVLPDFKTFSVRGWICHTWWSQFFRQSFQNVWLYKENSKTCLEFFTTFCLKFFFFSNAIWIGRFLRHLIGICLSDIGEAWKKFAWIGGSAKELGEGHEGHK